jgi:hypothetical protein
MNQITHIGPGVRKDTIVVAVLRPKPSKSRIPHTAGLSASMRFSHQLVTGIRLHIANLGQDGVIPERLCCRSRLSARPDRDYLSARCLQTPASSR